MRHLALDLGRKRIGLAISDPTGLIAGPLGTIQVTSRKQALQEVLRYLEQEAAEHIVIGLPLQMNGQEGIESGRAREFGRQLAELTDLPIAFMDERLTSVEADRLLQAAGIKPEKRRAHIDSQAAAIILQTYLNVERNRSRWQFPEPNP